MTGPSGSHQWFGVAMVLIERANGKRSIVFRHFFTQYIDARSTEVDIEYMRVYIVELMTSFGNIVFLEFALADYCIFYIQSLYYFSEKIYF